MTPRASLLRPARRRPAGRPTSYSRQAHRSGVPRRRRARARDGRRRARGAAGRAVAGRGGLLEPDVLGSASRSPSPPRCCRTRSSSRRCAGCPRPSSASSCRSSPPSPRSAGWSCSGRCSARRAGRDRARGRRERRRGRARGGAATRPNASACEGARRGRRRPSAELAARRPRELAAQHVSCSSRPAARRASAWRTRSPVIARRARRRGRAHVVGQLRLGRPRHRRGARLPAATVRATG